jgi:hypothetical protein
VEHPADLRPHMLQGVSDGGHGYPALGAPWETQELHERDHHPAAWWRGALTHIHREDGTVERIDRESSR